MSTATTPASATFTPAPAPTSAKEALEMLSAYASRDAALELLFAIATAMSEGVDAKSEADFADVPGISMFEAAGRLWANLGLSDEPYDQARRAEACELIASTVAWGEEPDGSSTEVDTDFREPYVARCYGDDGAQPGVCWVQVNRRADGAYVLSEGDDAVQNDTGVVFLTLDAARNAAALLAKELDEGDKLDSEAVDAYRALAWAMR